MQRDKVKCPLRESVECIQESYVNVGRSERETDKQANMPDGIET